MFVVPAAGRRSDGLQQEICKFFLLNSVNDEQSERG